MSGTAGVAFQLCAMFGLFIIKWLSISPCAQCMDQMERQWWRQHRKCSQRSRILSCRIKGKINIELRWCSLPFYKHIGSTPNSPTSHATEFVCAHTHLQRTCATRYRCFVTKSTIIHHRASRCTHRCLMARAVVLSSAGLKHKQASLLLEIAELYFICLSF